MGISTCQLVGWLLPNGVDLAIEACNRLGRKLEIVGNGLEERTLRTLAGSTITFLGRLGEADLQVKYATCRALVFAADEDFGLVAVEAQAHGRPVIAYGHGGSLETVSGHWPGEGAKDNPETAAAGRSGVFFQEQTVDSLIGAILHFERLESCFDPHQIREGVRRFDTSVFVNEMGRYVEHHVERERHVLVDRGRLMESFFEAVQGFD
jgi:glycosyltransferase involved in cell wall biosynthesis